MSLATQVTALAVRIATEFKTVYSRQGNLTSLNTTDKSSLVAAIVEVKSGLAGAGAPINDAAPGGATTYSGTKVEALVAAKPSINDTTPSTTTAFSGTKVNSAIATAVAAKPSINDTTPSTTVVYSASKTDSQIAAAKASILGSAAAAYDTLGEIQALMAADDTETSGILTALGNRLQIDAAQSLTSPQKAFGQANLDVYSRADIGDPTTDFVAQFVAALA